MLRDGDSTVIPLPRDRRALAGAGVAETRRAERPGVGRPHAVDDLLEERARRALLEDEVMRLRKRVDQQEHALARLSDALMAMRRGGVALRAENRELRAQVEAARLRARRTEG